MKQFIVDRHTTPNTPTLEQVPTEKVPIYETLAAAESDLANLDAGQIIATPDTGNELLNVTDTVQAGNMHAVTSNAVSEALSYSTTEQDTGAKWIDGKPIYRKAVDFGALPNTTTKTVNHNIPNIDTVIKTYGTTNNGTNFYNLPHAALGGNQNNIPLFATKTVISVETGTNKTSFVDTKVIIEYTKTTD